MHICSFEEVIEKKEGAKSDKSVFSNEYYF
jgi:hypothetical protein